MMGDTTIPSIPTDDEWEIRRIFNEELRVIERYEAGELLLKVEESRPARNTAIKGWVPGTLSQNVLFFTQSGVLVAKAHRFLRPDGSLAASGKHDPKRVLHEDRYLVYIPKRPESVP
jgi:hypothetical protein